MSDTIMDEEQPNIKRWIVFYPVYINSKKTLAEGRRIRAKKACENPTCVEISDSCIYLKLPCVIEADKAYPRDFMQRGRVRVQLKREDGSLVNPAIPSRRSKSRHLPDLVQMQDLGSRGRVEGRKNKICKSIEETNFVFN